MPHFFVDSRNRVNNLITINDNENYRHIARALRARVGENLLLIDTGIALAHIYVSNKDKFKFYKEIEIKEVKGYNYLGSFTLD